MNEYGKRFLELINKYKSQNKELLKEEKIGDFYCYRDDFPEELLIECSRLADKKAQKVSKKIRKAKLDQMKQLEQMFSRE